MKPPYCISVRKYEIFKAISILFAWVLWLFVLYKIIWGDDNNYIYLMVLCGFVPYLLVNSLLKKNEI